MIDNAINTKRQRLRCISHTSVYVAGCNDGSLSHPCPTLTAWGCYSPQHLTGSKCLHRRWQLRTLFAAVASRASLERCALAGAKIAAVSASVDACADNALLSWLSRTVIEYYCAPRIAGNLHGEVSSGFPLKFGTNVSNPESIWIFKATLPPLQCVW